MELVMISMLATLALLLVELTELLVGARLVRHTLDRVVPTQSAPLALPAAANDGDAIPVNRAA